jgi:Protein of unknown function (DUF4054)
VAAIVWQDVIDASSNDPQIVGFGASGQTLVLAVANSRLNVDMFDGEDGPVTKAARCYLAAHIAACSLIGNGGAIIAESEGGISRSYAMPSTRSEYLTTRYGSLYWQLIGSQARGPFVV